MKIGIIGAGMSGLFCGLRLSPEFEVVIFEKEKKCAGLCSGIDSAGISIEKYNHFISGADRGLIKLIRELGLGKKLYFKNVSQALVEFGNVYRLDQACGFLAYPGLKFPDKAAMILFSIRNFFKPDAFAISGLNAETWVVENSSRAVFERFFEPLLKFKFSDYSQVSAAYLLGRFLENKNNKIGYLQGGLDQLFQAMEKKVLASGARLRLADPVTRISKQGQKWEIQTPAGTWECDRIISTLSLQTTQDLLDPELKACLPPAPDYIDAHSCLLRLKQGLKKKNWLYLLRNERNELKVLIDASVLTGENFIYMPRYTPSARDQKFDQEEMVRECLSGLKQISPDLSAADILESFVFRDKMVEPVLTRDFLKIVEQNRFCFSGLYINELVREPRIIKTLNNAISRSNLIIKDLQGAKAGS